MYKHSERLIRVRRVELQLGDGRIEHGAVLAARREIPQRGVEADAALDMKPAWEPAAILKAQGISHAAAEATTTMV